MRENKRKTGSRYEELAAEYLTSQGLTVLERNYYGRRGELDLIARDGEYLVFAEVKYRKNTKLGDPLEAVDERKQRRIRLTAQEYLYCHRHGEDFPCRFDVIAMLGDQIHWIRDAF